MKRNKVAKLMVVAALVGAIGIGGSLALLTARSEAVTNTFTAVSYTHLDVYKRQIQNISIVSR